MNFRAGRTRVGVWVCVATALATVFGCSGSARNDLFDPERGDGGDSDVGVGGQAGSRPASGGTQGASAGKGGTGGVTGTAGTAGSRATGGRGGMDGKGGGPSGKGGVGASGGNNGGLAGDGGAMGGGGNGGQDEPGGSGGNGGADCIPKSCAELGVCGKKVDDGCGTTIACPACDPCEKTETHHARRAWSEGFSGTVDEYFELYSESCEDVSDCVEACAKRGGSEAMCGASECIEGFDEEPNHCLPATAWRNFDALLSQGDDPPQDGAELVLVNNPYHDRLIADDFSFSIPKDAEITGISVEVRRAADSTDSAVDHTVRLVKAGVVGAVDRSRPEKWGVAFESVTYGGPHDTWGETWTPADVNAPDFGVAFSALYTQTAGNGRAYVDIVRATIHYRLACDAP